MACTKNPILDYIDYIISLHNDNPSAAFVELFAAHPFYQIGTTDTYCCSDCGSFSYIGPIYNKDGTTLLNDLSRMLETYFPKNCCENYDSNNLKRLLNDNVINQSNDYNSTVCCNSFNDCSSAYNDLVQKYFWSDTEHNFDIYPDGIHEYGTFNGDSILCAIVAKIELFDNASKTSFFNAISILGGFVSYCQGGNVWVGTYQGFKNWW